MTISAILGASLAAGGLFYVRRLRQSNANPSRVEWIFAMTTAGLIGILFWIAVVQWIMIPLLPPPSWRPPTMTTAEAYAALGLPETPEPDWKAVRARYREMVGLWHPTQYSGDAQAEAERMILRINLAYDTLDRPRRQQRRALLMDDIREKCSTLPDTDDLEAHNHRVLCALYEFHVAADAYLNTPVM